MSFSTLSPGSTSSRVSSSPAARRTCCILFPSHRCSIAAAQGFPAQCHRAVQETLHQFLMSSLFAHGLGTSLSAPVVSLSHHPPSKRWHQVLAIVLRGLGRKEDFFFSSLLEMRSMGKHHSWETVESATQTVVEAGGDAVDSPLLPLPIGLQQSMCAPVGSTCSYCFCLHLSLIASSSQGEESFR